MVKLGIEENIKIMNENFWFCPLNLATRTRVVSSFFLSRRDLCLLSLLAVRNRHGKTGKRK